MIVCRFGSNRSDGNLEYECNWAVDNLRGNAFTSKVRRLALAACVYCIRAERNRRTFQNKSMTWRGVLVKIEDIIQAATWTWEAKRNFENCLICKEWGIANL